MIIESYYLFPIDMKKHENSNTYFCHNQQDQEQRVLIDIKDFNQVL